MHVPGPEDFVYAVVTDAALGLQVSDLATLIALIEELPFELMMILVSRLQGEVEHIRTDAQAQLKLAEVIFEDAETLNAIRAFVSGGPRRVVFSEQNLTALQRMVVLHARTDAGLDERTATGDQRSSITLPSSIVRSYDFTRTRSGSAGQTPLSTSNS